MEYSRRELLCRLEPFIGCIMNERARLQISNAVSLYLDELSRCGAVMIPVVTVHFTDHEVTIFDGIE